MAAEHLILGLLRDATTPFDLKAALDDEARHLGPWELADVQRALAALEEEGWVAIRPGRPPGPHADLARRTEAGEQSLRRWLEDGATVGRRDSEDPARVHVLDQLGDAEAVAATLAIWREKLDLWAATLLERERALLRAAGGVPEGLATDRFHALLSLRLARTTARARAAWCAEALRLFNRAER